jgi:hypothetical protein
MTAYTKGVSQGGETYERTLQKGSHKETLTENTIYSRILSKGEKKKVTRVNLPLFVYMILPTATAFASASVRDILECSRTVILKLEVLLI